MGGEGGREGGGHTGGLGRKQRSVGDKTSDGRRPCVKPTEVKPSCDLLLLLLASLTAWWMDIGWTCRIATDEEDIGGGCCFDYLYVRRPPFADMWAGRVTRYVYSTFPK